MPRVYEPHDFPSNHQDEGVTPNIDLIEGVLRLHLHDNGVSFGLVNPSDPRFSALTTYTQARQMMLSEAARVNGAKPTPKPKRRRTVLCFAGEEHELTLGGKGRACPSCGEPRDDNPCENCGHVELDKSQEDG